MAVKEGLVLVLTIESVVIGVVLGFVIRPFHPSNDAINLIGFPGEIFMQIVEMMILPLIISSVISALAQIRPNDAGRIGGLTVLYYVMTTFLSTFTGIILVSSIHPGDPTLRHSLREGSLDDTALSTLDTFLDQIRNMFPENIIQATFQQVQTNYIPVKARAVMRQPAHRYTNASNTIVAAMQNGSLASNTSLLSTTVAANATINMNTNTKIIMKPILEYTNEVNVLGLIVFCTGFGVILSILGEQARLMINFFIVLDAVIMKWISALMWCYPIGILSLVCKNILDIDNLTETAQALAMYVVTVICGLMIHSLLTLPLLFYLFTRSSPFEFMTGMLQAIATAFGTASSGASLPVTFRSLEGNLKIDRRVTRFVLPLGATITMDGTALYESVAVIFIAQLHNVQLSIRELLTISITTTVASIGSGSVPAGLDTILIVLATVGLPAKDLSLLLTVDWLLDRIRTSVNVLGDGFGCGIIYHLTKKRLIESDNDELIQQLKSEIKLLNAEIATPANEPHRQQQQHYGIAHGEALDDVVVMCTGSSEPLAGATTSQKSPTTKLQLQSRQASSSGALLKPVSTTTPEGPLASLREGAQKPPTASGQKNFLLLPQRRFAKCSVVSVGGESAASGRGFSSTPRRKTSNLSVPSMSSYADERRSLLDGSMEFTV